MAILMVQMKAPPGHSGGGMLQVFGEVRPWEARFARTPKNKDRRPIFLITADDRFNPAVNEMESRL